jgi:hypothetical protein
MIITKKNCKICNDKKQRFYTYKDVSHCFNCGYTESSKIVLREIREKE